MISKDLNVLQMEQIKLGIEHGADASVYSNPSYAWEHMDLIRHLMEEGIDPSCILNSALPLLECRKLALLAEVASGDLPLSDKEVQEYLDALEP